MQQSKITSDLAPEKVWERQKAKLKVMFPELKADDLRYDYGKKETMLMKLQSILKMSREDLTYLFERL